VKDVVLIVIITTHDLLAYIFYNASTSNKECKSITVIQI